MASTRRVVIVGAGFAGLNVAKVLGNRRGVSVTVVDRRNHHLFQPLLYQVATAGLSPAEIAAPIRSLLSSYKNITVLQGTVRSVDLKRRVIDGDLGEMSYDVLVLAAGALHSYFGHEDWEPYAPGLKTSSAAATQHRH